MNGWKTLRSRLIAVMRVALAAAMLGGALTAFIVSPRIAEAVPEDPPPPSLPQLRAGPPDLTISSLGSGRNNIPGFLDEPPGSFNPLAQDYPTSNPTSGFTAVTEYFVGAIRARTYDGTELLVYCIDIRTPTGIGSTYWLGNWDAATVPRVGFVAYILNKYYPATNEPAGLNANDRAAAVQAAIWYFTDGFVVNTSQATLHAAVAAIVADAKANGPLPAPAPPSLSITPTTLSGPAGQVLGPFTVSVTGVATQAIVDVTPTDVQMFADAAATTPIARGSTVDSGTTIYLRSSAPRSAVLQAAARASVPSGNAYLYTGGADARQKLILAQDAELRTTVSASADFLADGSLVVTKIIAGAAAQRQGQVVIEVTCTGTPPLDDFIIPAGTVAGRQSRTYTGIPLGAQCTVTETADGSTDSVTVTVTGNNQQVQIPPDGGSASAEITDTFELPTPTPTPTNMPVPPTDTPTPTDTPIPTNTPTPTDTPIPTPTDTPTSTDTPVPPTPTNTPVPPTNTPVPPTSTPTLGVQVEATATPTPTPPFVTPVLPMATPTNTPVPPTSTPTPVPPATATATPAPPGVPQILISKSANQTSVSVGGTVTFRLAVTNAGTAGTELPASAATPTATATASATVAAPPATPTATATTAPAATATATRAITNTPLPTNTPQPTDTPTPAPTEPEAAAPAGITLDDFRTAIDGVGRAILQTAPGCPQPEPGSSATQPATDRDAPVEGACTGVSADLDAWLHVAGADAEAQAGGIPLRYVTIEDRLPTGLTFVSTSDGGVYNSAARTIIWELDTLDPGATLTLSYTVRVNASGDWTNAACAAGAGESGTVVSDCADVTVTGDQPTPTPVPIGTPQPTSTPRSTNDNESRQANDNAPEPTGTPRPTSTGTPRPTSTGTPSPGEVPAPAVPAPRPTLTLAEAEVLKDVIEIVHEREAGVRPLVPVHAPVQAPVQVPRD